MLQKICNISDIVLHFGGET